MHRPQLLFLDEPTTGLDPQSRARMWDEVRGLRDTGTTVFLTTHYLEEADALSDRIAIIDHGKIVALGTPDELKRQVAGDVVVVGTDNAERPRARAAQGTALRPRSDAVPTMSCACTSTVAKPRCHRSFAPSMQRAFRSHHSR